jgi:hypothetical protein
MSTSTASRKKDEKTRKSAPKPPPGVTAYAHTPEEIEQQVTRIKAKHVYLAGATLLVVICASGWFILNVKNKLQQRRYIEAFKAAPDTIYAIGYVVNSMANNGLIGNPPPGMPMARAPQLPSHMQQDN